MFFKSTLDQIAKRKEAALAVFHRAKADLQTLRDDVWQTIEQKTAEIENLKATLHSKVGERETFSEEMNTVNAAIGKIHRFLEE